MGYELMSFEARQDAWLSPDGGVPRALSSASSGTSPSFT
jgi:hypothetical protein